LRQGSAGLDNYSAVLDHPSLGLVLKNTVIWVVVVVALTILISLGLAQFMAKEFFGRRVLRWAVIVPWAASLVITARLFTLILDYNHGILNRLLIGLHVISRPVDFLGDDRFTLASMIGVGLFVSIPFTAYVFLAGLNAIPHDVYEAARIDGAGAWGTYVRITLPLLRGPMLIAVVLNMIYVFNSFPIVYTLDDRNPGFSHDTTITYAYKLAFKSAQHSVGMSAAAGVLNVALILLVVLAYLRLVGWKDLVRS
jgi:multiple sugar transport system permease protein